MDQQPGLRERKKRQTREAISGHATLLILERGFDAVTVAEIARAAEVSEKTVFNYFPRKEDLFLDRLAEFTDQVATAVRAREEGRSAAGAVQDLVAGLVREHHPISGYAEPTYARFWQVVIDSPALQARVREYVQELEDALAALVLEGGDTEDLRARFAAASIVSAYRTVFVDAARRILAGEQATDADELIARYARAFAAVERGLDGF
jgi:AcrR family transcriptional regulator